MASSEKERWYSRALQAAVYLSMLGAAFIGLLKLPSTFALLVGYPLAFICGLFALLGSVLGTLAAIAGMAWLERVAILFAFTSLAMFSTSLAFTSMPSIALWFGIGFAVELIKRLVDITMPRPMYERKNT